MINIVNNLIHNIYFIFQIEYKDHRFNKNIYLNLLNISILLLPLTLISGPFLSDLSVVISGIILIIISVKEKNYKLIFSPISNLFFCFYLYLLIRSLFANNIILSLESSLFFFRFILFFMSVKLIVQINKKFINSFSLIIIFSFVLLLVSSSLQYFFMISPLNSDYIGERASGLFGTELIMGSYISRLLPLLISTLFFTNKFNFKFNILVLIISAISIFLVLISGERTALFNIILSFVLIFILSQNIKKLLLLSIVLVSFISIFLISSNETIKHRLITLTISELNLSSIDLMSSDTFHNNPFIFASHHRVLFDKALDMYRTNKIFGIGPKMFREACSYEQFNTGALPHSGCSTHPHNMYIQLLSETGIIGFSFIFSVFILILVLIFKQFFGILKGKAYYSNFKTGLLIAMLISLWPLIPSGNIFHNWTLIIYFLPLGLFLAPVDTKK